MYAVGKKDKKWRSKNRRELSARRRLGKRRNQPNRLKIPIIPLSPRLFSFLIPALWLIFFFLSFFLSLNFFLVFYRFYSCYLQWLALRLRWLSPPSPMRRPTRLTSLRPRKSTLRLRRSWYGSFSSFDIQLDCRVGEWLYAYIVPISTCHLDGDRCFRTPLFFFSSMAMTNNAPIL